MHRKEIRKVAFFFVSFLVSYVEERPWWPIKSPSKGRKKSERLRGEVSDHKSIDPRFER